jgi:hypothetical protein
MAPCGPGRGSVGGRCWGQAGAFLEQQRIGAGAREPRLLRDVLPGHRLVLGLAGEQDLDQGAGRLAVLAIARRHGGRLLRSAGGSARVLAGVLRVLGGILVVLAGVLVAAVGQVEQEQMPGEGGTDRGDAVDAGDQQPRGWVQGDVGVAEVERDRAAGGQGGQDPGIPGRLMWSGALFGQDGHGGYGHEGLEAEWP